ncbi:MAG: InlB B-repeat-containing protein [Acetatifactor sp.]|nr:InlB B-repeat-containing protein [Acetatifactor sp.]
MRRNGTRKGRKRLLARACYGLLTVLLCTLFTLFYQPMTSRADSIPADIAAFPESYQAALLALKAKHPNWTFVPAQGPDWNTAIENEMRGGKSLIHKSFAACVREGVYDQGNWYFASKGVLSYYMDPRNALTEDRIFQFEQLSFNPDIQKKESLENILKGSFMGDGAKIPPVPELDITYVDMIWASGSNEAVQVSPYHLAARIRQEQGAGTSALISGTYPGYEGYYNYYNIGATGTTNADIIKNGLEYAKKNWGKTIGNSDIFGAYLAILKGAEFLAENYIKAGQDSLYLQKYNVLAQIPYTHQYMQNITAPTTEAATIKKFYADANALESAFAFKIPVYQNMPATACPMPTSSTNIVLEITADTTNPYMYSGNTVMVDGEAYTAESYYNSAKKTRRLIITLPDGTSQTASIELRDASGNLKYGYYWTLEYKDTYYVATQVSAKPTIETFTITFDAGGGTGTMASVTKLKNKKYVLPECTFTAPEGCEFQTWNYGKPGDEVTVTADMQVKAIWQRNGFNIVTMAIPEVGGTTKVTTYAGVQNLVTLKATPSEGYRFLYWQKGNEIISTYATHSFHLEADTEVIAIFEKEIDPMEEVLSHVEHLDDGRVNLEFYVTMPTALANGEDYAMMALGENSRTQKLSEADITSQGENSTYRFTLPIAEEEIFDGPFFKLCDPSGTQIHLRTPEGADPVRSGYAYPTIYYLEVVTQ